MEVSVVGIVCVLEIRGRMAPGLLDNVFDRFVKLVGFGAVWIGAVNIYRFIVNENRERSPELSSVQEFVGREACVARL